MLDAGKTKLALADHAAQPETKTPASSRPGFVPEGGLAFGEGKRAIRFAPNARPRSWFHRGWQIGATSAVDAFALRRRILHLRLEGGRGLTRELCVGPRVAEKSGSGSRWRVRAGDFRLRGRLPGP
jgi:hypothetical protein